MGTKTGCSRCKSRHCRRSGRAAREPCQVGSRVRVPSSAQGTVPLTSNYDPIVRRTLNDGLADEYDVFLRAHPYEGVRHALQRLLGPGHGVCLDVGCGGGYFLDIPMELGWEPVGTDASRDQLRIARRRHPTTPFVLADAGRLPFADESFDAAISTFTHTDFDDFATAVREVRRVLRPGHGSSTSATIRVSVPFRMFTRARIAGANRISVPDK